MPTPRVFAALLFGLAALGCGHTKTTIVSGDDVPEDQWSRGVWLYGQSCARCHGEEGEGDEDAPKIFGPDALAEKHVLRPDFVTAKDVFEYVKTSMPPTEPSSLSDEQYWAVVLYMLKQGGYEVAVEPLDASSAGSVKLR